MWAFNRRKRPQIYVPPQPLPEAPEALEALRQVPGPSPWYLEGSGIDCQDGRLTWQAGGDGLGAKSILANPSGEVLAVTDYQCYIHSLNESRILVWYAEVIEEGVLATSAIRFHILDVAQLRPIDDLPAAASRLGKSHRFYAEDGRIAEFAIPTHLDDGVHELPIPSEFSSLGELLVLAHSTAQGRTENHFDTMHLRLWILDFESGRLEIVPQDWFNEGSYDFGYQWVTRVARLPDGVGIVGEGIRLGVFRLDDSLRNVDTWLVEDLFYAPRRTGLEWSEA